VSRYAIPEAQWPEERSSFDVPVTFLDDGTGTSGVAPKTASWRLTTATGAVVNNRTGVVIDPAPSVMIPLTPDDLTLVENSDRVRQIIVSGTYDSEQLGPDRAFVHVITFQIKAIKGWP
jgi:hypothetical protein